MSRDPRTDPRAGDVVRKEGITLTVERIDRLRVHFGSHYEDTGKTHVEPDTGLDAWQQWCVGSVVVHAEGEE